MGMLAARGLEAPTDHYYILCMRCNIAEVPAARRKMLIDLSEDPNKVGDDQMTGMFEKDLEQSGPQIDSSAHAAGRSIDYKQLINNPNPLAVEINVFPAGVLDEDRMLGIIDLSLYHQRSLL